MNSSNDFFRGIDQRKIEIRGQESRSPAFFRDLHMMMAIFTADLQVAQELMPTRDHRPLTAAPGRGLLAVTCFEYKDSDVGPYNEVGLSLGVQVDDEVPGFLAVARSTLTQAYHGYVLALPVNTEIALYGGLDYFNYPKFLAEIRFQDDKRRRTCRVADQKTGEPIYSFSGDRIASRPPLSAPFGGRRDTCTFYSYPVKDGRTLRARFVIEQLEKGRRVLGGGFQMEPGQHPRSGLLAELKPGRLLQYIFAPRCQGVLYEPEPI